MTYLSYVSDSGRMAECRAKNLCNGLSMFTPFSVEWGNSASFTSELADFLHVICRKESYQTLNNE